MAEEDAEAGYARAAAEFEAPIPWWVVDEYCNVDLGGEEGSSLEKDDDEYVVEPDWSIKDEEDEAEAFGREDD